MTEVSNINQEIRKFLAKNEQLKSLPKSEILSIMVTKGVITHEAASKYLKNSAFDTGYASKIEVIPQWEAQKTAFDNALNVLANILKSAQNKIDIQDKTEGPISRAINYLKETFDTDNKKSNSEELLKKTQKDLLELEKASSPEEFKSKFKELRGVEFSQKNIETCEEKSKVLARAENIKSTFESLKTSLTLSSENNPSNAVGYDANRAILTTFNALGIKNKNEITNILKDIETANKDNLLIKKYGGDFRIAKNKKGEYQIYRTAKNGFAEPATFEQLQMIAGEMKHRVNTAYATALGIEVNDTTPDLELEKQCSKKFSEIQSDYYNSFEKAYGKDNITESADNYITSQKQNTAYVEAGVDFISIASMFVGGGIALKGAKLLGAGTKTIGTLTNITSAASKAMPFVAAGQVLRPVSLIETLGAEEPDWTAYGMSVKEGAIWMALGMTTGALGDKARLFLGQKGLSAVAKNTGKSIDQLINMYKSGHKLPANLRSSLSLIENASKISGTSAEFIADILMTYGIQKGIRGEDLTAMDYIMSANGAIMGTVMHKTFSNISDIEKIKVIQKSLTETNPNMTKQELEKASKQLLEIHRLAEEKRNPKTAKKVKPEDKHDFINNIAELKQHAKDGNLRGLDVAKNLSAEEQLALIKTLEISAGIDDFLMTATKEKPSCWIEIPKDFDASKMNSKEFEALKFERKFGETSSMILLNKKMVKDLIEENTELYAKRLGLDKNSSNDDIYRALVGDLKTSDIFKQDLLGVTLGFGRDNGIIFQLEQIVPDFTPEMRQNLDIYKKAIKEALYSENSPYKDFDEAFKAGVAERIDEIKEISNPYIPGYHSVDYTRSIYEQNQRIEHLRAANKKLAVVNDDSVVLTRPKPGGKQGELELNEIGEEKARKAAESIHNFASKMEKSIVKTMEELELGKSGKTMTHRPKSAQSLYDKIKNAIIDDGRTFSEAIKGIRDSVGTRTKIADINYKDYPEIVEMYKKDPKKAIKMAAEKQSEIYLEKVKALISAQGLDPKNNVKAIRISNYMGADGIPYFSKEQVQELMDLAAKYDISLHIKTPDPKVRDSGYTALQMNFISKDGVVYEWQMRGSKINTFAECEHVPYDIRTGKKVTGGNKILENLYKPLEDMVKGLKKEEFDAYNRYLTDNYEHLRLQELGFDSKPPKLEDYGLTDPKLKVENLELLHDLSSKLKSGKITEPEALKQYFFSTDAERLSKLHPDIKSRIDEFKLLVNGINDKEILKTIMTTMTDAANSGISAREIFAKTEFSLNLAEIYHAANEHSTPIVRANGINAKSETEKYLQLLKKLDPSRYNELLKTPSLMDRIRKRDWSADERADLRASEKFQHLIEFISQKAENTELCNYLYKEYYLKKAELPKEIIKKCLDINDKYGVKIIPSKSWLEEPDRYFNKITSELENWKQASGGKAKFPPAIDTLAIKFQYLQGAVGTTSVQNHDIMLNPNADFYLSETLRHELTHLNDTKFRQCKLPDDWKAYRTINYHDGSSAKVLDAKNCKYADELHNAGLDYFEDIPYAFTDADEFIAQAATGDMSKYSPEFKKVLISLGMPEWMFNMKSVEKN